VKTPRPRRGAQPPVPLPNLGSKGGGRGGGHPASPRGTGGHAGRPPSRETPDAGGEGDPAVGVGRGGHPGDPTRPADPPSRRGPAAVRGQLIPPPPPPS